MQSSKCNVTWNWAGEKSLCPGVTCFPSFKWQSNVSVYTHTRSRTHELSSLGSSRLGFSKRMDFKSYVSWVDSDNRNVPPSDWLCWPYPYHQIKLERKEMKRFLEREELFLVECGCVQRCIFGLPTDSLCTPEKLGIFASVYIENHRILLNAYNKIIGIKWIFANQIVPGVLHLWILQGTLTSNIVSPQKRILACENS